MSLRDWFAGQALQGLAVMMVYTKNVDSVVECMEVHEHLAQSAFAVADAMIAARKEKV